MSLTLEPTGTKPMKLADVIEKGLDRMKSSAASISITPADSVRLAAAIWADAASTTVRLLKTMLLAAAGDAKANVAKIPNPTSATPLNFIRNLRKFLRFAAGLSKLDTSRRVSATPLLS